MDILTEKEHVKLDQIQGHGGLFKTKGAAQRIMAGAMEVPVSVMETAGEGGAWGIALLAAYMGLHDEGEALEDFLSNRVFGEQMGNRMEPAKEDVMGFRKFMKRYKAGLSVEKAAGI